jgi:hypothetical protein
MHLAKGGIEQLVAGQVGVPGGHVGITYQLVWMCQAYRYFVAAGSGNLLLSSPRACQEILPRLSS